MSDKVGWFFGPAGTYTASPFPLSTHSHTHTHAQGQRKIKLKREMICFSFCHVATVLLTFPFPYSIIFFVFRHFENIIFLGASAGTFYRGVKNEFCGPFKYLPSVEYTANRQRILSRIF